MDRNSVNWKGNICAVTTPFRKDGSLDEKSFTENLTLLRSEGIEGFVLAGCTGEFWALSFEERVRLFELARNTINDVPVIGNATEILTSKVVKLGKAAAERGLDGIMVLPPYYAKPSDEEIVHHYEVISKEVPLPILVYNIPKRQAVNLSPKLLSRLADVDRVVAVKQSTDSYIEVLETMILCRDRIRILSGHSVNRGVAATVLGADGYVSSTESLVMGREAVQMYNLVMQGRLEEASKTQFRCVLLDEAIHGGVGTFPASVKAAMNLRGRPGGYPREPLLPLNDEQLARLRSFLKEMKLL